MPWGAEALNWNLHPASPQEIGLLACSTQTLPPGLRPISWQTSLSFLLKSASQKMR